jgi:hypothetical protein
MIAIASASCDAVGQLSAILAPTTRVRNRATAMGLQEALKDSQGLGEAWPNTPEASDDEPTMHCETLARFDHAGPK